MKREILEIADDLSNDAITPQQAQTLLLRLFVVSGSLPLQTKLEMFYDFLYERGVAKQLGVGIDTIVKHFIDEKLLSNDR